MGTEDVKVMAMIEGRGFNSHPGQSTFCQKKTSSKWSKHHSLQPKCQHRQTNDYTFYYLITFMITNDHNLYDI